MSVRGHSLDVERVNQTLKRSARNKVRYKRCRDTRRTRSSSLCGETETSSRASEPRASCSPSNEFPWTVSLLLRSDFCKHQPDSAGGGDSTHSQNFSAFLLKRGILRSSNNIQDRLCHLRKYVHFYTKKLHGFNETGKKMRERICARFSKNQR
jgi:hypothetical protein